jgi:uncharacterized protein (TIGR02600 family)
MKTNPLIIQRKARRSGMALLFVLGSLVLISALLVAFMTSVKTDHAASDNFARGAAVKLLSDSALNLVMAQIKDASTTRSGGNTLAWTSQPGMIRTFNATGNLNTIYKLYSWSGMKQSGSAFNPASPAETVQSDWVTQKAIFTDLNAPVSGVDGLQYPIVDPDATIDASSPKGVEGFSITNPPGSPENTKAPMPVQWLYVLQNGTVVVPTASNAAGTQASVAGATTGNPIVGRIAFWTDDESCKVNINTAAEGIYWDAPRAFTNYELTLGWIQPAKWEYQRYPGHPYTTCLSPVLARYLDETRPVGRIIEPTATAVDHGASGTYSGATGDPLGLKFLDAIYKIIPRVAMDSPNWGTHAGIVSTGGNYLTGVGASASIDSKRLYASVDEMMFDTSMSGQTRMANALEGGGTAALTKKTLSEVKFFLTASSRSPDVNLFNKPRVCIWPIDNWKLKNPRPSLVAPPANDQRSPLDKVIGFCSSIGLDGSGNPYQFYFTRNNPYSGAADWTNRNLQLYTYLENMLTQSIPGYDGGSFSSKYSSDYRRLLTSIVDYIRCTNIMAGDGPTAAQNAATKTDFAYSFTVPAGGYGGLSDYSRDELSYAPGYDGGGVPASWHTRADGASGQIIPLKHPTNNTKGFGRFPTINQVGIQFIATHVSPKDVNGNENFKWQAGFGWKVPVPPQVPGNGKPYCSGTYFNAASGDYNGGNGGIAPSGAPSDPLSPFDSTLPNGATRIQAVLMIEPIRVTPGYPGINADYRIDATGMGGFAISSLGSPMSSMNFSNTGTVIAGSELLLTRRTEAAAVVAAHTLLAGRNLVKPNVSYSATNPGPQGYPFFSASASGSDTVASMPIIVGSKFDFKGADLTFRIKTNTPQQGVGYIAETIQTISIKMPDRPDLPVPSFPLSLPTDTSVPAGLGLAYSVRHFGSSPSSNSPLSANLAANQVGRYAMTTVWYGGTGVWFDIGHTPSVILSGDVVRSVEIATDARVVAGRDTIPLEVGVFNFYRPHAGYDAKDPLTGLMIPMAHSFRVSGFGNIMTGATGGRLAGGSYFKSQSYDNSPAVGSNVNDPGGDWDTNLAKLPDGPYINMPDEGNKISGGNYSPGSPFFQQVEAGYYNASGAYLTSPAKLMPSAIMFGSLPTGVSENPPRPFQTLLFCPNPRDGQTHYALRAGTVPDHVLLDLFSMPVVEPYPISEPFSTAGRINMNYRMMPFYTYMKRDTGLRAVFKSVKLMAIPQADVAKYKGAPSGTVESVVKDNSNRNWPIAPGVQNYRYNINANETLKAFETKFDSTQGVFRSAGEICELFLYPSSNASRDPNPLVTYDSSNSAVRSWWDNYKLTGDNMRERPYAMIYPRLTTKSNSYTIHMRVQELQKIKNDPNQATWVEDQDQVRAEYRGSATIERYIDPNYVAPNGDKLPDFADASTTQTMDDFYRFRVVSVKQFAP